MPAEDLARPGVAGSPGQPMLRRIGSLLAPYRWWLALVLVTVLGVGLARRHRPVSDPGGLRRRPLPGRCRRRDPGRPLERLYWLVAGLIAIPLVSALIGVGQTYLTNRIGNSAMADLRVALFEHLEKMELASSPRPRPATFRRAVRGRHVEARFDDAVEFTDGSLLAHGSDRRRPM